MAITDKTPLWLDLKKEYIDDNFNKLQTYLHDPQKKEVRTRFTQRPLNYSVNVLVT